MTGKIDNLKALSLMYRELGIKETDRDKANLPPPDETGFTKSELTERLIRWIDAVDR